MNKFNLINYSRWISRLTVALMPLVVLPSVIYPFMFGKTLFLHTTTIALLVIWVVLITFPDQRKKITSILKNPITLLFSIYLATAWISSLFGVDLSRSFWGTQSRGTGLLTLTQIWLWFVLTRATHTTTKDYKRLTQIISVSGLVVSLIALARLKGIVLFGVDTGLRISGTIANPIFFAGMLILYIGIAGYGFFTHEKRSHKFAFAALALFQTLIMFFTQTRGAAIGFIVGAVIAGMLVTLSSKRKIIRHAAIGCIISGLLLVSLVLIFHKSIEKKVPLIGRLVGVTTLQDSSLVSRVNAWKSGWESFKQKPILGWGQESFIAAFDVNYNPDSLYLGFAETRFDRAHNIIVELLVTGGVIGLLAYAALMLRFLYQLWQSSRWKKPVNIVAIATLAAYMVHLMFSFDTAVSLILLFAIMLLYEKNEIQEIDNEIIKGQKMVVFGIAMLVGLMGVYRYAYQPMKESSALINTLVFAAEHSRLQATPRLQGVLDMQSPYKTESRNEYVKNVIRALQAGVYSDAEAEQFITKAEQVGLKNIIDHKHDSYHTYLNGVLYYTAAKKNPKYAQKGIEYFNDAIKKSERQQYLFALAELYVDAGDPITAHKSYKQAHDLSEKVGLGHWYYGLSLLTLDQDEEGVKELIEAIELGHIPVEGAQKKLTAGILLEHKEYDLALVVYWQIMHIEGNIRKATAWAEYAIYLKEGGYAHSAKLAAQTAVSLDESFRAEAELFIAELPEMERDDQTDVILDLHKDFDVIPTL